MTDKAAIVMEFLGSLKSDAGPPRFDLLTDDVTYTSSRGTVTGRDTATKYMAGPTAFTFYQKGNWSAPKVDGEVIESHRGAGARRRRLEPSLSLQGQPHRGFA